MFSYRIENDTVFYSGCITLSQRINNYSCKIVDLSELCWECETMNENFMNNKEVVKIILPRNLDHVVRMMHTFADMDALEEVVFPDTMPELRNMFGTFEGCTSLKMTHFPTIAPKLKTTRGTFMNCTSLEEFTFDGNTIIKPVCCANMFKGCTKLKSLQMNTVSFEKIVNMRAMCEGCISLIEFSNYNDPANHSIPITNSDVSCYRNAMKDCPLNSQLCWALFR